MWWTKTLLPLAAVATAIVIPDEQIINQLQIETKPKSDAGSFLSKLADKSSQYTREIESLAADFSQHAFDTAMQAAESVHDKFICHKSMSAFDAQGWLESATDLLGHHGHHGDHEDHGDHGDHGDHDHHGDHGKHGKHGPHGHHSNKTVYQLINECKHTTKLASLINEYDDLVDALNGTAAKYTIFAPTDKAFERAMKHHEKPTKEQIKMILAYHISAEYYPAGRVLVTHTIPTTYGEPHIDGNRQRLRVGLGLRGLAVNFYARIIAIDYFGSNGVIHGIDHVLLPPPQIAKILTLLPADFSTLTLALEKTGLWDTVKKEHHRGGTFFAPSNWAFQKLGPKINMYLFSEHGKKHLEALLKYHIAPETTLYSDAVYHYQGDENSDSHEHGSGRIPKGKYQIDLPTLLEDRKINVDILRFGGFIMMKLNGFNQVSLQDGIAKDGVLHKLDSILIPPKAPGGHAATALESAEEDMTLEEFKERLDGYYGEL